MNYAWLSGPQKIRKKVRVLRYFTCGTFTQQLMRACHVLLCFALLRSYRSCVPYTLSVCGNPASSKPISASAHFMSLGHILVILALFQTFPDICMVICDQRSSVL